MARKLTMKYRRSLPARLMGLAAKDKYPLDTRGRAGNAKARAEQQLKKGTISASEKRTIDRKANRVLYGSSKKPNNDEKLNSYINSRY